MTTPLTTLNAIILAHAEQRGGQVFCHLRKQSGSTAISYQALVRNAMRYAVFYQAQGAQPGSIISIVLGHGEDLVYAFVGALLGGYVPSYLAPLGERQDPAHYWEQLKAQCQRMEGGLLLTQPDFAALLGDSLGDSALRVLSSSDVPQAAAPASPPAQVAATDIALLQHSSGTTGGRKGVALSHQAVLAQLERYAQSLQLGGSDVIVSWLPLYHDMGLISSFLLPLMAGVPLVLLDPFEWVAAPWTLLAAITEHRGTLTWLPNFAFHFLARVPLPAGAAVDLSSMRAFINCSEPCKAEAFELFLARFQGQGVTPTKLHTCYAMAEMVFAVSQTELGQPVLPLAVSRPALQSGQVLPAQQGDTLRLMPVGRLMADADVHIVRDDGARAGPGEVGEIAVAAPYMFSGYYKEDELTARALRDGFYLTGDLGALVDGQLYITGRKKDLVIVNGKNYYTHDIEAAVNQVPGVKPGRCVAFGLPNAAMGSEALYVVAETELAPDAHAALARAIKDGVQKHMGLVIAKAVVVPGKWLVKTTSGKISRGENREKYLRSLQPDAALH